MMDADINFILIGLKNMALSFSLIKSSDNYQRFNEIIEMERSKRNGSEVQFDFDRNP